MIRELSDTPSFSSCDRSCSGVGISRMSPFFGPLMGSGGGVIPGGICIPL